MESEDNFWRLLSRKSLKRAWTKEDRIWDESIKKVNESAIRV